MSVNDFDASLRLFDSDLTPLTPTVSFNGKKYKMNIQITAFGSFANQMTDYVSFLTGNTTSTSTSLATTGQAATDHFRKLVARSPDLHHGKRQLRDHIQVYPTLFYISIHCLTYIWPSEQKPDGLSYLVGNTIYLTYAGAEKVAQLSQNPYAIQNREAVLNLLNQQYAALRDTMHVSTKSRSSKHNSSRVKEAMPGSMPECTGDSNSNIDNLEGSATLVSYWPNKSKCSTEEFEHAVECYFSRPEIVAVKERMEVLEDTWLNESILKIEKAVDDQTPVVGYVYALWNPLFADLIKIGATLRTPEIRARELSGTGMPEPFEVVAKLQCRNPFSMEREIHMHYANVRKYGKKKEFFTTEADNVNQYFHSLEEQAMRLPSKKENTGIKKRLASMKSWRKKAVLKTKSVQTQSTQTSDLIDSAPAKAYEDNSSPIPSAPFMPVQDDLSVIRKRKIDELEIAKLDQDFRVKEQDIRAREQEIESKRLANQEIELSNLSMKQRINTNELNILMKHSSDMAQLKLESNAEDLRHKIAMQECERDGQDQLLKFKRAKLELESEWLELVGGEAVDSEAEN